MGGALIVPALIVTGIAVATRLLLQSVASVVYDIRHSAAERQRAAHPHARQFRPRPLITILVSAHNHEAQITNCLNSIISSSYKKLEVIIVDGNSSDKTRQLVTKFIKDNPKQSLRLVRSRSDAISLAQLVRHYKTHGHGELVLALSADDRLRKDSLQQANHQFNAQPTVSAVELALILRSSASLAGLMAKYFNLQQQRANKMAVGLRSNPQGIMYRANMFRALTRTGAESYTYGYAQNALIERLAPRSFKAYAAIIYGVYHSHIHRPVSHRRVVAVGHYGLLVVWTIGTVLTPVLLAYFMYLAYRLHQPALLVAGGSVATLVVLLAIWENYALNWRQKIGYTVGIPLTYGVLFVVSIARSGALLYEAMQWPVRRVLD